MTERIPFRVKPMLATRVAEPFHKPGWVYEEKYDGYRIFAYKEGDTVTLLSRNAKNRTASFPDIAASVARLTPHTLLLDGEVVAFDSHLVSRFQLLQRGDVPQIYVVFDCLYVNGRDLRGAPLRTRRRELEAATAESDRILPSRRLAANGLRAYRLAKAKEFEGLVAKDATSPYVQERSARWLKVKIHQEEEFVVGGYTAPAGSRAHFGALLLGAYRGTDLRYVGKVGTGFSQRTLTTLWTHFQPLIRRTTAFVDPPRERDVTWLAPQCVAQIAFGEWTHDRKLRHPVFLGLRTDKTPQECLLPDDHV